jgi:hypothetical protein
MAKKSVRAAAAEPTHGAGSDEKSESETARVSKAARSTPRLRVRDSTISIDHSDRFALGSSDRDFLNFLVSQLANVSSKGGQIKEEELKFMVKWPPYTTRS